MPYRCALTLQAGCLVAVASSKLSSQAYRALETHERKATCITEHVLSQTALMTSLTPA